MPSQPSDPPAPATSPATSSATSSATALRPADYYKLSWAEIQPQLLSWVAFYAVFIGVSLATCGLGTLLMPNAIRELRDTRAEGRGPELGRLFDMQRAANDLINTLIWMGAMTAGSAAGGVGGYIAAVALQFQMPLAADDRYSPIDNARLSLKHVGAHLGDHVVFLLIGTLISLPAVLLCMLPLPIVAPVLGMAQWLWFEDSRAELDRLAADGEVRLLVDDGPQG